MKTPEEIKKGLEYLAITDVAEKVERAKQGLTYAYTEDVAADALALIQQMEDQVPRWISVEERLPEFGVPVIVCRKYQDNTLKVEQGKRQVNGWWKVYGTNVKSITHWMPLPNPPEI